MRRRPPSPLDVLEARVAQLAAALAALAPPLPEPSDERDKVETPPGPGDASPLRAPPPPANDPRASGP
jgi:hypothetical protein